MEMPVWIAAAVADVEEFHTRRLPASLSMALRCLADCLASNSPTAYATAVQRLRDAERAASDGDLHNARVHYAAALADLLETGTLAASGEP